jgi:diguanylate cyclase (GGDEF)-like protein
MRRNAPLGGGWFAVAAGLTAAAALALAWALVEGEGLANAIDDLPLLFLAGAVLAALYGWRQMHAGAEADRQQALEEGNKAEALTRRLETEREWRKELRRQIQTLEQDRGALGATNDVPALVLKTARELVGAQKGLLLSRKDEDADGNLDLMASEGFQSDPADSAVAQRFAREVIASDQTVREESPTLPAESTPADREIENLLAIPIYLRDKFSGVVVLANKPGGFEDYDDDVLLALGDHAGAALHNARLHGELRAAYISTVAMLAEAVEAKDPFLRSHSYDATRHVSSVAKRLGMSRKEREDLVFGSLLHDVGKIGISERILLKPGPLTSQERSLIELHPRIGYRIVQQVPILTNVAPAILHHHERFDGEGYPSKLSGEEIPLQARIIAVADAFCAMTTNRPYREAGSVEDALAELERCAGTQFDPEIVRLFGEEVRASEAGEGSDAESDTDTGEFLVEALSDPEIMHRRQANEPVLGFESYSITDNLTMLYGHRHFWEMVQSETKRAELQGKPFAVVMVELVDLERINSEDGYAAGDEAIKKVARAVQAASLQCQGTAARFSGRRIAVVIPRAGREEASGCADEIAEELAGEPKVRVACAVWGEGDSSEAVVGRSGEDLRTSPVFSSA